MKNYLDKLLKELKKNESLKFDFNKIEKAYYFAEKAHEGQKRKSGEDYITHPLEASVYLAGLKKVDTQTIIGCLLHDTIEDTNVSENDILNEFGEEILLIVQGVTKIFNKHLTYKQNKEQSLRKILLAISEDLRVVFIKFADRLHNLKTISFKKREKQILIAEETLAIYSPICERLGIFKLKDELETESLKILDEKKYKEIEKDLEEIKNTLILKSVERIENKLKQEKFKYLNINGRLKSIYSCYSKIKAKHLEKVDDLYDIYAIRIIVKDLKDCYELLGIIHKSYKTVSSRFKDYISNPKENGYKSIHTTIFLKGLKHPLEVQIRTQEMHIDSEYGAFSHWKYKEGISGGEIPGFVKSMNNISNIENSAEFLQEIHKDALSERIFVFTPNGEIINLPNGAIPIDFAFAIHSEVGLTCFGTKINNKQSSLYTELQNGDRVEIFTKKIQVPNPYWLSVVKSSHARNSIRRWMESQNLGNSFTEGKKILNNYLRKFGKKELDENLSILTHFKGKKLTKKTKTLIVEKIGNGIISPIEAFKEIFTKEKSLRIKTVDFIERKKDDTVSIEDISIEGKFNKNIKISTKCCKINFGDRIIGFVTRSDYIGIHNHNCSFIAGEKLDNLISAEWKGDKKFKYLLMSIEFNKKMETFFEIIQFTKTESVNVISLEYKESLHPNFDIVNIIIKSYEDDLFYSVLEKIKGIIGIISIKTTEK